MFSQRLRQHSHHGGSKMSPPSPKEDGSLNEADAPSRNLPPGNLPAVDLDFIVDYLVKLATMPSPAGYTDAVIDMLDRDLASFGLVVRRTNKGSLVATMAGRDTENHRLLSGHVDTLGGMVREVKSNGRLKYAAIGSASAHSVEGEYCAIFTDDGRRYTGTILPIKASSHVHGKEYDELPREVKNMEIRLDERVKTAADTRALGIEVGSFVAFDSRTEVTPAGFIKSRHLDDKAGVAVLVGVARCLAAAAGATTAAGAAAAAGATAAMPAATTHFLITNFEEVGHGASCGTPAATREFIAVDMGCVGEGMQADEQCVSICAKDSSGPYDAGLRRRLVALASRQGIPHAVDVYPAYASDASAALRSGADVRAIVIGPGVDASHALERTHRDGLRATADLLVAYLLS
jgi:putative aminopeptidase FrvX